MARILPCDSDRRTGACIRERRIALGITQESLGRSLGVSFQQVQKYEKGVNRIAASLLPRLCELLQCNISDLVGTPDADRQADPARGILADRQGRELAMNYLALPQEQRAALARVAAAMRSGILRPGAAGSALP